MEDDRTGGESQIKIRTAVSARTAANIPAVSLQKEKQLGKCYREMAGDAAEEWCNALVGDASETAVFLARNGMRCVGGMTSQAAEKSRSTPQGLKPVLKQSLIAALKTLRHPKTKFFHPLSSNVPTMD